MVLLVTGSGGRFVVAVALGRRVAPSAGFSVVDATTAGAFGRFVIGVGLSAIVGATNDGCLGRTAADSC